MIRLLTLYLLFAIPLSSFYAQEITLNGSIQDENGQALAYVNIGILGTATGTVSDQTGKFTLYLKDATTYLRDTLRCSSIGYLTKDIIIEEALKTKLLTVQLKSAVIDLVEVVVKPNNLNTYTKGKTKTNTKRNVNFSISGKKNQNLGSEIGKFFKLSSKNESFLKSFRFYVTANDFEQVKFRVNVYQANKKRPAKIINQENIIVQLNSKQTGWINVDLSPYELSVKGKIIIGVEWIEHSSKGRRLAMPIVWPSFGSKHYYKYGSQSKWKKFNNLSTAMELTFEQ